MLTNLNTKLRNVESRRNKPKPWLRLLMSLGLIIFVLTLITFFPARSTYLGAQEAGVHSQALASAYQNQNLGQLVDETTKLKESLINIDSSLNFLMWMRLIPVVGSYYSDAKRFSVAGVEYIKALEKILLDLKPFEKELGFLGSPLAGQDRISQAMKILEKAQPSLSNVEPNFKKAKEQIEEVDINKYPEDFRGYKLRSTLRLTRDFIIGTYIAISENKQALELAPNALGQSSPKTYLLLFQNDKEIRATGGFITAYAFLKIDRGQVITTVSDDIYRLDERLLGVCQSKICPLKPPAPIVKYLPEVTGKTRTAWSMRDSNISPHLPQAAAEFERMYQLLGQGLPFDGVIYIDSQVVEELIEVTGPLEIYGIPYSAKVDPRCNCPNVIYELEAYAEIAAKGTQDRKAILGVLMQQILAKSVGADIEKMPQLIETIARLANHKHVMFYMHDEKLQQALSKLNWTGEIKNIDGDYLHINDSNFAGGKSNLYVEQTVTQDINVQKDGTIKKKLTIEYKNPQPFNIWLNGINRDYIRIYAPKGSKLVSSKGSDDPVNTYEELEKTVFDAFLSVRPQNSRKLEFEYTSPYDPKGLYNLLIQKQPGAKDFRYIIKINGRQVEDSKLEMDKLIQVKI